MHDVQDPLGGPAQRLRLGHGECANSTVLKPPAVRASMTTRATLSHPCGDWLFRPNARISDRSFALSLPRVSPAVCRIARRSGQGWGTSAVASPAVTARSIRPAQRGSAMSSLKALMSVPGGDRSCWSVTDEEPNALLPADVPSFLASIRLYPEHFAMTYLGRQDRIRCLAARRKGRFPKMNAAVVGANRTRVASDERQRVRHGTEPAGQRSRRCKGRRSTGAASRVTRGTS